MVTSPASRKRGKFYGNLFNQHDGSSCKASFDTNPIIEGPHRWQPLHISMIDQGDARNTPITWLSVL